MNIFSKISKEEQLSPGLKSLYTHKVIRDIGIGLVGMFGPIFVFSLLKDVKGVLLFYGLISFFYLAFLPLMRYFLGRWSMNVFLFLGTLGLIVYYLFYFLMAGKGVMILSLFVLLIVLGGLFKFFYWVPYHVDLVSFMNKHHRGRQLSFLGILVSILGIFLPVFSGWVISRFSFTVLFLLAMVVLGMSLLAIRMIPKKYEIYSFDYGETWQKIFSGEHFKTNLAYGADGFQESIGFVIWPIFIFLILKEEYLYVGVISTVVILISTVIRYLIGEATDRFDKKKLMRTGSILYFLGWIGKAVVETAFQVFLAGTFHNLSAIILRTPLDATTYEIAADEGHYIDEFSVLKEMSLHLGKVTATIFSIVLLLFLNIYWLFILAAMVSVLVNLVSKEEFYLVKKI